MRGYYKADKNDRRDKKEKYNKYSEISPFEQRLRVDMTAEITTLDQSILPKIKKDFDGKTGKLGC